VQTTFGGVCGAKKGGLALHFGLESALLSYRFCREVIARNIKQIIRAIRRRALINVIITYWWCEYT
ncbi:hypothetical protein AB7Z36_08315, partial [Providencia rettgeri]